LVDHRAVFGLDRRRLCASAFSPDQPQGVGLYRRVPVDDNQAVKAGQVLARIDPSDYQTALDQARANVAAAQANIETLNRQIHQQRLAVAQARQQVAADQAATVYAQQNFERYTALARTGYGPVQMAQQSTADIRQRQAALQRDSTAVDAAMAQIRVFKAQRAQAKATLAQFRQPKSRPSSTLATQRSRRQYTVPSACGRSGSANTSSPAPS
jgi:membrane fusion protein (multidrug efflux system)